MAPFRVSRRTSLSPEDAWHRLTDWERHGEFIPFTTVTVAADGRADGRPGGFVARTSLGPIGFDDPMDITEFEPPHGDRPGLCRIVKRGRVVVGWAELTVSRLQSGALVVWEEDAGLRLSPRPVTCLSDRAARRMFGRLVDGLLAGHVIDGR